MLDELFRDEGSSNAAMVSKDDMACRLFQYAMEGEWKKIVGAYKYERAQKLKITNSEDTALHLAVSDDLKETVLELVEIINKQSNALEILSLKNAKGSTPLHLAAELGDAQMCHEMASKNPKLVSLRNHDDETPLFLAALNGNDKAFFCLHSHSEANCYSFRATNADTILHAAISAEHFSMAYQIIRWHPELVNSMNQNGSSPLHILASTRTAFRSSSRLGPCHRLIYHGLVVEELTTLDHNDKAYCPLIEKRGGKFILSAKTLGSKLCYFFRSKPGNNTEKENEAGDTENPKETSNSALGDTENPKSETSDSGLGTINQREGNGRARIPKFSKMYASFVNLFYFLIEALVLIDSFLSDGVSNIKKIHEQKERHEWAIQVMNMLLENTTSYFYVQDPKESPATDHNQETFEELPNPNIINQQDQEAITAGLTSRTASRTTSGTEKKKEENKQQTPILIAAKMGVIEMVKGILEKFPVAIRDVDCENKNVALLAVENRQPHVYKLLVERKKDIGRLLRQVDKEGNNALHLAAKFGSYRPWLTPGAALQMQWELKWYTFVQNTMPACAAIRDNNNEQVPKQIFATSHTELQREGRDWLVKTSESCSVVAALIAAVAFATSASVPGGLVENTGEPVFKDKPTFNAFSLSSLLALCLSVTALVYFLSILTSRYEVHDFSINLPRKLLMGLTSLFASIASVLVAFCTGHISLLDRQLRYVAYPLYAATCLPVTIFVLAQLPLYYDLIRVIIRKEPQRSYQELQH